MRKLEVYLAQNTFKAALVDQQGKARPIPDEIFRILDQVTNALAAGEGITVVPAGHDHDDAAGCGFPRDQPARRWSACLEAGDIAYDKPGRHRRVRLEDLVAYQSNFRAERRAALRELQQAGLGAKVQVGSPADVKRLAELDG
jgi:hypothetical protein